MERAAVRFLCNEWGRQRFDGAVSLGVASTCRKAVCDMKKLFYALVLSGTALGLAACGMGTSSSPGAGLQLLPDGGMSDGGAGGGIGPVGGTGGGGGGGGAGGGGPMGW
jgi:hypothetical protein